MNAVTRSLCVVLSLAFLSACHGQPCESADVQRVSEVCRLEVSGTPNFLHCRNAGLSAPGNFDWWRYATEACNAQGSGRLISCIAARADECRDDAGVHDYALAGKVLTSCSPPGSTSAPGTAASLPCAGDCRTQLDTCLNACPTSDWGTCTECVAPCEIAYGQCFDRCS